MSEFQSVALRALALAWNVPPDYGTNKSRPKRNLSS